MKKQKTIKKGFTLIELLVSLFVFSFVITMSMTSVLTVLDANRKAQSLKSVMNNLNFALESMNRDLRYGSDYRCGGASGDCNGGNSIKIRSDRDVDNNGIFNPADTLEYKLEQEQILRKAGNGGDFIPITAPEIKIEEMKFYVTGSTAGPSDIVQPRIQVIIRGYAGKTNNTKSKFNLQTTISQRCLDTGGCRKQ